MINNCAVQFPQNSILDITSAQLINTFESNFYSYFYLTKATLPHLMANSSIINTASITAFAGKKDLIDYSSTKGAIVSFTRSLSLSLADMKIRVNAVAPGPVWTPLIPSSFSEQQVEIFGTDVPLKRAGEPFEIAPAYLYLASDDSRYVTGQVIHGKWRNYCLVPPFFIVIYNFYFYSPMSGYVCIFIISISDV